MWRVKSYRILDPKFKTFSRLYSKTKISFFRLKVIKYMINRDLKKRWCATSIRARLNKTWTKRKKLTYKVLVVALKKKTQDFLSFFPDFISIFQTFSRSGKLLGKFQDFFKNSRVYANPESGKRENWPRKTGAPYPSSQQYFPTHRCAKATLYIPRFLDHLRSGRLPLEISDLPRENRTEI